MCIKSNDVINAWLCENNSILFYMFAFFYQNL